MGDQTLSMQWLQVVRLILGVKLSPPQVHAHIPPAFIQLYKIFKHLAEHSLLVVLRICMRMAKKPGVGVLEVPQSSPPQQMPLPAKFLKSNIFLCF